VLTCYRNPKIIVLISRSFKSWQGTAKQVLQFRRKQIIFSQGDPGDSIFYLASGKVKLTITSEKGRDAIVGVLSAGAFLGRVVLLQINRPALTR